MRQWVNIRHSQEYDISISTSGQALERTLHLKPRNGSISHVKFILSIDCLSFLKSPICSCLISIEKSAQLTRTGARHVEYGIGFQLTLLCLRHFYTQPDGIWDSTMQIVWWWLQQFIIYYLSFWSSIIKEKCCWSTLSSSWSIPAYGIAAWTKCWCKWR